MHLADELELTAAESQALDTLLEAMASACRRRLPVTLELAGVSILVERPCEHQLIDAPALGVAACAPEELH